MTAYAKTPDSYEYEKKSETMFGIIIFRKTVGNKGQEQAIDTGE